MTARRAYLARRVAELRAEGLLQREVAARLGISRSHVSLLASDPDGSRELARKDSYRGVCGECGGPTTGTYGPTRAPERCGDCRIVAQFASKYWTRARVIDAIQRFAAVHGRPPISTQWDNADPHNNYPNKVSVYRCVPASTSPFASWSDAIAAAGFPRPANGKYMRTPLSRARSSAAQRAR